MPFSVLVLDFDGLRAANAAFGNRDGGDVLIAAFGRALSRLAAPGE
jgi:GGDEF domain-containing protein